MGSSRSRAVSREIRLVERWLYEHWDPIGVKGDAPDDEYASYAPRILSLLMDGAGAQSLAHHLDETAHQSMGLSGNMKFSLIAAEKLVELWSARRE